MAEPINGDELLARVKPQLKEHRTQICLRPDLVDEWERLDKELREAKETTTGRLSAGNSAAVEKLAQQVVDVEAQIEEASAWFTFRALPQSQYRAVLADHPPREDNQMDAIAGHDRDAVADVLIRKCLVDPTFTEAGWRTFMETCAASEWVELREAAFEANGGSVTPPKSALASEVLSKRAPASKRRASGD